MKRTMLLIIVCAALASCSPTKYSLAVELSGPSKSGLMLTGKTISVAYMNSGVSVDSLFLACTADSFTEYLEKEYYDGEKAVGLYKVDSTPERESHSKEGMVDLVMETGTDLAFLFDVERPQTETGSSQLKLYAYDSLDKTDTVQVFLGKVTLDKWNPRLYGQVVGRKSADIFSPSWTSEKVVFYCFGGEKWSDAIDYASEYSFRDAADIWLTLVKSKDRYKAACAQYNIAVICYVFGQNELAIKWLDRSDANYQVPESVSLRRKVNARL